jgi:glycosyltransferase involved in cell wall biosynthesis
VPSKNYFKSIVEPHSLLEIFVVTYNRRDNLKRTLEAIQSSPLNSVKITILDNSSTDGTDLLLKNICEYKSHNWRVIRHPINIGATGNLMRAYEIASTDYIWVICDDDDYDFSRGAEALSVLDILSPDVLVVGSPREIKLSDMFPKDNKVLTRPSLIDKSSLALVLTFCPSAILRTDKLLSSDFQLGYFLSKTYFPHFFWISKLINDNWSIYIFDEQMIQRSRGGHGLESNFIHINGYLQCTLLLRKKKQILDARSAYWEGGMIAYVYLVSKFLMEDKLSGSLNLQNILNHLILVGWLQRAYLILILPITLLPSSFLRQLIFLYKHIKRLTLT